MRGPNDSILVRESVEEGRGRGKVSEKTENYIHVSTVDRPRSRPGERATSRRTAELGEGKEEGPWSDSWANRRFRAMQGCPVIVTDLKIVTWKHC